MIRSQDDLDQLTARIKAPLPAGELSDQIKALNERIVELNAAIEFVTAEQDNIKFRNQTVRQVLTQFDAELTTLNTQLSALEVLNRKLKNFANRKIGRFTIGEHAGNGKCYIAFVNVGMGDCTLVTTPEGKRIMIDCGSDSLSDVILDPNHDPMSDGSPEDFIRRSVMGKTFLNGTNGIDILFLTHPDADHHDKLETILSPCVKDIGLLYYGGADNILAYTSSAYLKTTVGTAESVLRKVRLCEEKNTVRGEVVVTKSINDNKGKPGKLLPTVPGKASTLSDEYVDGATGAIVVYHEKSAKSDFKISILAGNVEGVWMEHNTRFVIDDDKIKDPSEMRLNSTRANRRSLVILIECFNKTVLVCGDATAVTENFVAKHFGSVIGKVDWLRVGHHGSPTSSCQRFLRAMPKMLEAVVSTGGEKTRVHSLPKQKILDQFTTLVPATSRAHNIFAYEKGDGKAQLLFKDITTNLFTTGSNDSLFMSFKKP